MGTDDVFAVGAVTLLVAAAGLSLAQRLLPAAAVLAVIAVVTGVFTIDAGQQQSGRLSASDVRNWSPLYRERERRNPGALSGSIAQESGYRVREARDTRYHRMFVLDGAGTRYLRFDSTFQSAMRLDDHYATEFEYTDYLQLGLAYAPTARRVLFIGLGGGTAPKRMWRDFEQLQLHAVEIDPEVVRVARRWFDLPRDNRLKVTAEDGRRFLQTSSERWDMIVIDAYFSDSIPFHLSTAQFFELVRSRLSPGGVAVSNVIGSVTGPDSKLLRSMTKTYRSVFPTVALHPVSGGGDITDNVIVVASEGGLPAEGVLKDNWTRLRRSSPRAPDLSQAIEHRWPRPIPFDDVPLLTDGYAPTDSLLVG
jgi:spermidine synthase